MTLQNMFLKHLHLHAAMENMNNPNVLTRDEVETLLCDILIQENLSNAELVIDSGSEKGDGYASFMTKVDANENGKTMHFIIKCAPRIESIRVTLPFRMFFEREIFFYEIAYHAFVKFQEERNVKYPFNNVAKCYKSVLDPNEIIVLENIRYKNFDLFDRKGFMNDAHIKLLLETYGKYHAISFAMQLQNKNQFEKLASGLTHLFGSFDDEHDVFCSLRAKLDDVAVLFEWDKNIHDALLKFKENVVDFIRFAEKRPEKSVLIHGDCWCNNMMFKYENPNNRAVPDGLCLLDFQLAAAASPVLDVAYCFYASASKDCLENLDHYLKFYYQSLKEHAEALGSNIADIYTYDDLLNDWKIYSKYGFTMCLLVVIAMLTRKEDAIDMSDVSTSKNQLTDIFTRKLSNQNEVNERFIDLVNHFYERGWLNCDW